jgi:hypothetical protein
MQDLILASCVFVGMLVIVICIVIIVREFVEYLHYKKQYNLQLESDKRDLLIIEKKLPDIYLHNMGDDIDLTIGCIMKEPDIETSMEWGKQM